jgi:hypothetical protein
VTASSVYTTETSISGTDAPITTTSFGYKVAQATDASGSAASASATGAADRVVVAGGAAAAALAGVIAML